MVIETPEGNKAKFEEDGTMLSKMLADTRRRYKAEKNLVKKINLFRMIKILEGMLRDE